MAALASLLNLIDVPRQAFVPRELTKRPFTLEQALAAGLTRHALAGRSWRRLGRGLYCWRGAKEDPWQLLSAWRDQLPSHAVFAGLTAAWLYSLDVDPLSPIEVVVPPRSGARSRNGLHVRHCQLAGHEVTVARGFSATTIARTFRDLRPRLDTVEVLVLADAALRLNLGRFDSRAGLADSPMETRLRWIIIQGGLPTPEVQTDLLNHDGRFVGRADLYYPESRLVIEYDGLNHRDRLAADNRRQNLLIDAGFRLLRFTAHDVYERPGTIVAQIQRALTTWADFPARTQ